MDYIIQFVLMALVTLTSCSITGIPNSKDLGKVAQELQAENVTATYSLDITTQKKQTKLLEIEIINSKLADYENRLICEELAINVIDILWGDLRDIDSTVSSVNIIFSNQDREIIIGHDLDELYAVKAGQILDSNEYDRALKYIDKAISLAPFKAKHYNNRGYIYCNLKKFDAAINDFTKACDLEPDNVKRIKDLGLCYSISNQYEKALSCFNEALEIDKSYAEAYGEIGNVFHKQKLYEKAIQFYEDAHTFDPNNTMWMICKAVCYLKLGILEKADTIINEVIHQESDNGLAILVRGKLRLEKNENNAACNDFQQAIDLNVEEAIKHFNENCSKS